MQSDILSPKWNLVVYSDSDWAGDKEKRTSVTGFIIFFMDVPIIWRSKAQASVALSSTEAEYYAISEAAKETKFVYQLLKEMGIEIELPIIMRVDNVGAIFMSENPGGSSRTRHIDTRYHFVKEFIEDGFIKIIFVKSAENKSDGFRKNTSSDTYESHTKEYMIEKSKLSNHQNEPRKGVTGLVPSDDPGTGSDPVTERNSVNDQVESDSIASPNRGETPAEVPERNDVPNLEGKESKVMGPKEILK